MSGWVHPWVAKTRMIQGSPATERSALPQQSLCSGPANYKAYDLSWFRCWWKPLILELLSAIQVPFRSSKCRHYHCSHCWGKKIQIGCQDDHKSLTEIYCKRLTNVICGRHYLFSSVAWYFNWPTFCYVPVIPWDILQAQQCWLGAWMFQRE